MDITDVRVRKLNATNTDDSRMRAIVSVTFDNEFVVHDIKVIQGTEKLFIAMPSRRAEDGTYKDITHPIKSGFRDKLQDAVMSRYEQALTEEKLLADKKTAFLTADITGRGETEREKEETGE